jgi:WD40 repeat protein
VSREVVEVCSFTRTDLGRLDDYVNSVSFSHDGQLIASASASGVVGVHTTDGECDQFRAHQADVSRVAFSPTAAEFATGGLDGHVRIWSGPRNLVSEVAGKGWCNDIAWRRSGGEVAAALGKSVVRALSSGLAAVKHDGLGAVAECVAWSSCGRKLFVGAYGGVWMFQGAEKAIKHFPWKGSPLTLRISPDDKWIATGNQDASLHCWKIASGSDLQMTGFESKVQHIAWNEKSVQLANASFNVISLWDFSGRGPSGSRPKELISHTGRIVALDYLPTHPHLLVSAATDGSVCVWKPQKSGSSPVARFDTGLSLSAMALSPCSTSLAMGSNDGDVLHLSLNGPLFQQVN